MYLWWLVTTATTVAVLVIHPNRLASAYVGEQSCCIKYSIYIILLASLFNHLSSPRTRLFVTLIWTDHQADDVWKSSIVYFCYTSPSERIGIGTAYENLRSLNSTSTTVNF